MDFRNYPNSRQPWESFEQFEYRLRKAQEEELRRIERGLNGPLSMPPSMLEMTGIGRDENYREFCARIDRERVAAELQRTKQNTKKLILLL